MLVQALRTITYRRDSDADDSDEDQNADGAEYVLDDLRLLSLLFRRQRTRRYVRLGLGRLGSRRRRTRRSPIPIEIPTGTAAIVVVAATDADIPAGAGFGLRRRAMTWARTSPRPTASARWRGVRSAGVAAA